MRIERTNFELDIERDRELMSVFKQVMASKDCITLEDALKIVANSPSSRFWVSKNRAWRIIQIMLKGRNPHFGFASKRAMYEEIFKRVVEYRNSHPKTPIAKAVSVVIHQPAPQFYLSPKRVREMIYEARQREKKNQRKLFGLFTLRSKKDPDFEKLEKYVEGSGEHIG